MSSPEMEWLNKARDGDDEAFSQLVEAFQKPVYNLCYRMLGSDGEAEDAAQETFWRAYQNLKRYDTQRPFITWLLSIGAHYCIDQLRKRRMQTFPIELLPEEDAPDDSPSPEHALSVAEEQRRLRQTLDQLGPQDRAAIILRYWYDLSDEEIGETLSLTVSAVKSRLHRARRELARLWLDPSAPTAPPARRHRESLTL